MQENDAFEETAEDVAEKIFMLCKKFAEKSGGKILLSHDSDGISTAVAAMCAGTIAISGKRCICFKNQPLFATRSAVRTYLASGGIHIYTDESDRLCVAFVDEKGNIADFYGGKTVFSARLSAVGIIPMNGYKYHYIRKIVSEYENVSLKYKILVSAKSPAVREMLKLLFFELECDLSFYAEERPDNANNREKFISAVKCGRYDAGICIGNDGESVVLADENGRIITQTEFERLCACTEKNRYFIRKDSSGRDAVEKIVNLLVKMKNSGKTLGEFAENNRVLSV